MVFQEYKNKILKDPRADFLNFEKDGFNHYVYRVSNILKKEHYYGSRTDEKEPLLGIKYFTSAGDKQFKVDFKKNPSNYKIKIIKTFTNKADKILYESYLHQYFNVKNHTNFINQVNQTPFGFDRTGVKASRKTRNLMSLASLKRESDIALDKDRSDKRSKNMSNTQRKIASDKNRYESRSKNMSKANAKIASDPILSKKRKRKKSKAAIKVAADIAANPNRAAERSKNASEAQLKLLADPKRALQKIRKISKAVIQLDKNYNPVGVYSSQTLAAKTLGYPNSAGISQCVNGLLKFSRGFKWISCPKNWSERNYKGHSVWRNVALPVPTP